MHNTTGVKILRRGNAPRLRDREHKRRHAPSVIKKYNVYLETTEYTKRGERDERLGRG